jgi:hypothetical protein
MQDLNFISKARQASSAHTASSGPPPHSGPRARGWLTERSDDSVVHHRSGDRLTCSRPPMPAAEAFPVPSPTPPPPASVYVVVHNSHGGIIDLANMHSTASARLPAPPDRMLPPPPPRPSAAPLRKDDLRRQLGHARPTSQRFPPLPLQYTSSVAPTSEQHHWPHPAVAELPYALPAPAPKPTATQKRRERQLKAARSAAARDPPPPDATADKLADLEARLAAQEAMVKLEAPAPPAAPPAAVAAAPPANADVVPATAPPHPCGPPRSADHEPPVPSSSRKRPRFPRRPRSTSPLRPGSSCATPSSGSIQNFLTDFRERSTTRHHPRHQSRSSRSRSRSRADRPSDSRGRRPRNRRRSPSRSASPPRRCSSCPRPARSDARPRSDRRYDVESSSRATTARRRLPCDSDGRGRWSPSTSRATGSSPRRHSPPRSRPSTLPPPRERQWVALPAVDDAAPPPPPAAPGLTPTRALIAEHQAAVERLSRQDAPASLPTPLLDALGAAATPTPSQIDLAARTDDAPPLPGGLDPASAPPSSTEVLLGDGYRDHARTQSPELVPCPPGDGSSTAALPPAAPPAQSASTTANLVHTHDGSPRPRAQGSGRSARSAQPAQESRLSLSRRTGRGPHRVSPVSPPRTGTFALPAHLLRDAPPAEHSRNRIVLRFGQP